MSIGLWIGRWASENSGERLHSGRFGDGITKRERLRHSCMLPPVAGTEEKLVRCRECPPPVLQDPLRCGEFRQSSFPALKESIITAIIFGMLRGEERGFHTAKFFRGFFSFLPRTLLCGYAYLQRYTKNFKYKVYRARHLVKIYLACCVISEKYSSDCSTKSADFIAGWDVSLPEFNYIEGLVANGIRYDFLVSQDELDKVRRDIWINLNRNIS